MAQMGTDGEGKMDVVDLVDGVDGEKTANGDVRPPAAGRMARREAIVISRGLLQRSASLFVVEARAIEGLIEVALDVEAGLEMARRALAK